MVKFLARGALGAPLIAVLVAGLGGCATTPAVGPQVPTTPNGTALTTEWPPYDGAACSGRRWLGVSTGDECPQVGAPWAVQQLDVGVNRVCLYRWIDPVAPSAVAPTLPPDSDGRRWHEWLDCDPDVVASMACEPSIKASPGQQQAEAMGPLARNNFIRMADRPTNIPNPEAPVPVAVLDTTKDGENGTYMHGATVARAISALTCKTDDLKGGLGGCATAVSHVLTLDATSSRTRNTDCGGRHGYLGVVAEKLRQAVPDDSQRRVVNMSFGWEPEHSCRHMVCCKWAADKRRWTSEQRCPFRHHADDEECGSPLTCCDDGRGGGFLTNSCATPLPDRSLCEPATCSLTVPASLVLAELKRASCKGAVGVAAAGNAEPGTHVGQGMTHPAAWTHRARLAPAQCQAGDWDAKSSVAPGVREPLLIAVSGVESGTRNGVAEPPLANGRAGGETALVAIGLEGTVLSGIAPVPGQPGQWDWQDGGPKSYPTPILTGSSVSAAVASAAVALALALKPGLTMTELLNALYSAAMPLGRTTTQCWTAPAGCSAVKRISVCRTLAVVAGADPAKVCTTPPVGGAGPKSNAMTAKAPTSATPAGGSNAKDGCRKTTGQTSDYSFFKSGTLGDANRLCPGEYQPSQTRYPFVDPMPGGHDPCGGHCQFLYDQSAQVIDIEVVIDPEYVGSPATQVRAIIDMPGTRHVYPLAISGPMDTGDVERFTIGGNFASATDTWLEFEIDTRWEQNWVRMDTQP